MVGAMLGGLPFIDNGQDLEIVERLKVRSPSRRKE